MLEEDFEIAIKVVIVGNGAVGKSSMIQRYCKGIFTRDYKKTIGVDFLEKELEYDGETVRLMLWDTAGQEEFDAITRAYYRGAQACVLAFSTTDRASFDAIVSWKKKVEAEVGEIPMVLVQNKIDLIDQAVLSEEECELLAKTLRLRLYKTSVKENFNVDSVFDFLAEKYMANLHQQEEEKIPTKQSSIGTSILSATSLAQHYNDRTIGSNLLIRTNNSEVLHIRNELNGSTNLSARLHRTGSGNKKKEKCSLI